MVKKLPSNTAGRRVHKLTLWHTRAADGGAEGKRVGHHARLDVLGRIGLPPFSNASVFSDLPDPPADDVLGNIPTLFRKIPHRSLSLLR
jgi:hypothetical protein